MVFIKVDSVVVLTSGETTTTWMLSVLAHTSVPGRYVTAELAGFRISGRHLPKAKKGDRIRDSECIVLLKYRGCAVECR